MQTEDNGHWTALAELHQRTANLIAAAGARNDKFLQYLYGLALRHLEEQAGIRQDDSDKRAAPFDPEIKELTDRLVVLCTCKP